MLQNIDNQLARSTHESPNIDWFVKKQVLEGTWYEETIPAEVVGLARPLTIYRACRKTDLITYDWHGDRTTFCPPMWWDIAIGSGACGLGCRACFLMLTHRIRRNPWKHVLYDNYTDFYNAVVKWLLAPSRRRQHTLGVGIDRSDSLLYEGVTGHIRRLAPLFTHMQTNPQGCKLVLLTKSANTHYLSEIAPTDRQNIVVSFSLNPESIADLWEGKWQDGVRITPSIQHRLKAAAFAQALGFEIRVRIDPILTPPNWQEQYRDFVEDVKRTGIVFRYWTLGTYREKNAQLDMWRQKWELPEMEWEPENLIADGTHRHLLPSQRIEIYHAMTNIIRGEFPLVRISLCKETHDVRKALQLCNADCNCLL